MAGVTVSGVLWAVFQNNAGGAWDNAKKSFEAGVLINGEMTYKGSDAHKAAVTGDTVGDPFKDTSGPSMNILIKLTCLIGLVIAPILGNGSHTIITKASCCTTVGACTSMSAAECIAKGCTNKNCEHHNATMMGHCDMSKMATMSKEECAKMCDEMGCTPGEKEMCMSHYDVNGKFIATSKVSKKEVKYQIIEKNGKSRATVTTIEDGKEKNQIFEGSPELVKAKVEALK